MSELVQSFSRAAHAARDMEALRLLLTGAAQRLGFHHLMLQGASGAVWLTDMPPAWQAPQGDAALAAASQCYAPFLWSDIPRLIACTPAQRAFLDDAALAGLGAAVTVPVHRARGADDAGSYSIFAGACTFAMKTEVALPLASLAAAHYVGAQAFDAAERLRLPRPANNAHEPHLTPRQRDCVALVAQGKSDWEIGRLLGISDSTVHKHVEDAKRRFGVSTRIQLVVRSLRDARLSFAEVIDS
ncbi:MAG: LuxR-family transcriptional regulator [Alphaproteobacteria bacterium]|nr:LuxR-family transcriptional regulator [Alphaproteobacteria bacterium]